MIPRSAGIRTHLARGAARADFLLESDPRNFGGIAGQESGFAYWAAGEKPKNYLGKAEIPLENCRLRARPSSAVRTHWATVRCGVERALPIEAGPRVPVRGVRDPRVHAPDCFSDCPHLYAVLVCGSRRWN